MSKKTTAGTIFKTVEQTTSIVQKKASRAKDAATDKISLLSKGTLAKLSETTKSTIENDVGLTMASSVLGSTLKTSGIADLAILNDLSFDASFEDLGSIKGKVTESLSDITDNSMITDLKSKVDSLGIADSIHNSLNKVVPECVGLSGIDMPGWLKKLKFEKLLGQLFDLDISGLLPSIDLGFDLSGLLDASLFCGIVDQDTIDGVLGKVGDLAEAGKAESLSKVMSLTGVDKIKDPTGLLKKCANSMETSVNNIDAIKEIATLTDGSMLNTVLSKPIEGDEETVAIDLMKLGEYTTDGIMSLTEAMTAEEETMYDHMYVDMTKIAERYSEDNPYSWMEVDMQSIVEEYS
jgi:uncharacterized protein YjbJ (UPF0337 family)